MNKPDINHWVERTQEGIDQARARAADWDDQIQSFTRENPVTAVLCALAGGYVLARLTSVRFR